MKSSLSLFPMPVPRIVVSVILSVLCTGCREDAAPMGPAPGQDTLRIVDTLIVRDTVRDTVATPLGACTYRQPAASDTLAGDFAPLAIGNEWVYGDSSAYSSVTPTSASSSGRNGTATLRLIRTICEGGHLEHSFRFEFMGARRKAIYDGRTFLSDSVWQASHGGTMTCRDDGTVITCDGLAAEDAPYLGFFGFHRVLASQLQTGADPFTGMTALGALSGTLDGFAQVRYWKGAGVLGYNYSLSTGTTGSGYSRSNRISLVSFNGIPTPYR